METYLFFVLLGVCIVNGLYYLAFLIFAAYKDRTPKSQKLYPVSLLVCAKNEAENLKKHIPLWLSQKHTNFELILIDDASHDQTAAVIEAFAAKDSRVVPVYVSENDRFVSGKKYALTLGIKKASHARLIFTDADCVPNSDQWLSKMSKYFSKEKAIVLGYSPYKKLPNFLNLLIRFETFITALQYFSYARLGLAYMGVGRNLGYTRGLYEAQKGFASHMHVASGDDDLFINKAATAQNVACSLDADTFTTSLPKTNFSSWFRQKKRHVSTSKHYKPFHQFLLGLYYLSNLLFWVLFFIGLFFFPMQALLLGAIRIGFQILSHSLASQKLKQWELAILSPVLELFLICLQLPIFIAHKASNNQRWN